MHFKETVFTDLLTYSLDKHLIRFEEIGKDNGNLVVSALYS